jgi:tetratricopeptide (TPR) repeat protein
MLGFAWLTLRQAQEALKNGRLEEAHRLLGHAQGHKRSWELLQQVAKGYVERGQRRLRQDDAEGAWGDLLLAEQVGAAGSGSDRLRLELLRLGLAEVRALLETGEPSRAGDMIARLQDRAARHPELPVLDDATGGWLLARELAARGEFARAVEAADRVRKLLPGRLVALEDFRRDLQVRQQKFASLLPRLHEATEQGRWGDVVALSELVLALAPQHREARKARALAWKSVQPAAVGSDPAKREAKTPDELPRRFLLWADGVGGFLICLGSRISFGQATLDAFVDVPLLADVSRLHATITRDEEGYLLETVRPVQVNGQTVDRALLRPNDRITLGACCQFRFRQPSPVSTTARLDLVSGHRLPVAVDAVLLMADTLVLGPGAQAHVTMPWLKNPVVLFRHKDGLGVRGAGNLTIDGRRAQDRALLGPTATVAGDEFAFAVEPVGTRMGRV